MKKNDAPAFQFYPKDFLSSEKVSSMSNEERGQYITLLCLDWVNGGITEPTLKGGSPLVQQCFKQKGERWFNPRLEVERKKQAEWREKSRLGGIKSGKARKQAGFLSEGCLKGGSTIDEPKANSSSSSSSSPSVSNLKSKPLPPDPGGDVLLDIFNYWNSLEIIPHRKLTDNMKRAIKGKLEDYTPDEIKAAIRNYAEITKSDKYWISTRHGLDVFLRQNKNGFPEFLDSANPHQNYKRFEKPDLLKEFMDNA